jgi:hypothetical protein
MTTIAPPVFILFNMKIPLVPALFAEPDPAPCNIDVPMQTKPI